MIHQLSLDFDSNQNCLFYVPKNCVLAYEKHKIHARSALVPRLRFLCSPLLNDFFFSVFWFTPETERETFFMAGRAWMCFIFLAPIFGCVYRVALPALPMSCPMLIFINSPTTRTSRSSGDSCVLYCCSRAGTDHTLKLPELCSTVDAPKLEIIMQKRQLQIATSSWCMISQHLFSDIHFSLSQKEINCSEFKYFSAGSSFEINVSLLLFAWNPIQAAVASKASLASGWMRN